MSEKTIDEKLDAIINLQRHMFACYVLDQAMSRRQVEINIERFEFVRQQQQDQMEKDQEAQKMHIKSISDILGAME